MANEKSLVARNSAAREIITNFEELYKAAGNEHGDMLMFLAPRCDLIKQARPIQTDQMAMSIP